jgi:hypothetical protein
LPPALTFYKVVAAEEKATHHQYPDPQQHGVDHQAVGRSLHPLIHHLAHPLSSLLHLLEIATAITGGLLMERNQIWQLVWLWEDSSLVLREQGKDWGCYRIISKLWMLWEELGHRV